MLQHVTVIAQVQFKYLLQEDLVSGVIHLEMNPFSNYGWKLSQEFVPVVLDQLSAMRSWAELREVRNETESQNSPNVY